jgi:sarcosine oxidase subunit alpha
MACRTRVRGGETVETQNVLGSRELDLLSASDFLFPHGIDAHRLFAGVAGASTLVTKLARRIAGLGRLPDAELESLPGRRRDIDVLIVGGGNSGLAAARELGPHATLLDDGLELGGKLALLDPPRAAERIAGALAAGAELLSETTAFGVYRDPADPDGRLTVLGSGSGRVTLFRVRRLLLATGCHDAVPSFGDADLPGVFSARAALALEASGIALDERLALVGAGPFTRELARRVTGRVATAVEDPLLVERAAGKLRLRSLWLQSPSGVIKIPVGALSYEAPGSPAFELAVQAGGGVEFQRGVGYAPRLAADGRVANGVYCAGSVSGAAKVRAEAVGSALRAEPG